MGLTVSVCNSTGRYKCARETEINGHFGQVVVQMENETADNDWYTLVVSKNVLILLKYYIINVQ